jgi:large subunit ribosomal protein L29
MSDKSQNLQAAAMRERPHEELTALLADKVEEHRKVRFKHALGQLPNSHVLGNLRREIAKLKTVLSERHQGSEERT